jgi:hypothetical protein
MSRSHSRRDQINLLPDLNFDTTDAKRQALVHHCDYHFQIYRPCSSSHSVPLASDLSLDFALDPSHEAEITAIQLSLRYVFAFKPLHTLTRAATWLVLRGQDYCRIGTVR